MVPFRVFQIKLNNCLIMHVKNEEYYPSLVFINIYAPNNGTERKGFLETVNSSLNGCSSEDFLFLGGDFNCTEAALLDRNHAEPHPASQHTEAADLLPWPGGCVEEDAHRLPSVHLVPPERWRHLSSQAG